MKHKSILLSKLLNTITIVNNQYWTHARELFWRFIEGITKQKEKRKKKKEKRKKKKNID